MLPVELCEEEVLARCTPQAAERLARLKQHSRYVEILKRLESQSGLRPIYQLDVEQALAEVLTADHIAAQAHTTRREAR